MGDYSHLSCLWIVLVAFTCFRSTTAIDLSGTVKDLPGTHSHRPHEHDVSGSHPAIDRGHHKAKDRCLELWDTLPHTEEGAMEMPPPCLKFVATGVNMSSNTTLTILRRAGGDVASATRLLHSPSLSEENRRVVIDHIKNHADEFRPEMLSAIVAADLERVEDPHNISRSDLEATGSLVMHLSADKLRYMNHYAFDYILDYVANMSTNYTHMDNNTFNEIYRQYENNTRFLQELCRRAFRYSDHLVTTGRENMRRLAWLLPCAPARVCRNADTDTVRNNLDLFQFLPWSCGGANIYTEVEWLKEENVRIFLKKGAACGRALVEKAGRNLTDWNNYKELGLMMKCAKRRDLKTVFTHISCTDVENTVKQYIEQGVVPDEVVRQVSRRCLAANVSSFDCGMIQSYGAAASGLPRSFFKDIPTNVLCNETCFEGLMRGPLRDRIKRFLSRKCRSSITIDSHHAMEMGSGIVDLPVDIIRNISTSALMSTLEDVKTLMKSQGRKGRRKDPRKRAVMRQIARKLKTSGNITSIMDSEDMIQELSIKDLRSSVTDVVHDLGLENSTVEPHFSDFQNKFLMRRVIETESPGSMTESTVRNLKTLVTGLVSSQITALNPLERTSISVALCEQSHWPLKSAKFIFNTLILQPLLDMNNTHPLSVMSAVEASNIGCECLMYIDPAYLANTSVDTCQAICGGIGACSRFRCLNPPHRSRMLKACLQCMGVSDSAQITNEVMSVIGYNLIQQLNATEFTSRIATSDISTLLPYFNQGCVSKAQRDALKNRLIAEYGDPSTWDADFLYTIRDLVYILGGENINSINETAVVDIVDDILNGLVPTSDENQANDECCRRWLDEEDRAEVDSLKRNVLNLVKKVKLEPDATRKKRSVASLTCEEISNIGDGVLTLTNAELQAVTAEEFADCLSVLGQIEGWSSAQRSLLYEKAETDIGDVCTTMTAEDVADLGSITLAMPVTDIECATLDEDIVEVLGQQHPWSDEQLSALASRYTALTGRGVNAFTADDVAQIGNVVCGFSSAQLLTLPPSELSESGAQLGQIQSCPTAQLQALAEVAVHPSAYGPTSGWDASTLSEIGILTAGLTASALEVINSTSIEGISVQAIPLIPPHNLAFMSVEQLREFGEDQAKAVTDVQTSGLSTDQRNVLLTSIHGPYAALIQNTPDSPGNAAGRKLPFHGLLAVLISTHLCAHFIM